jgi:hypothetical protein
LVYPTEESRMAEPYEMSLRETTAALMRGDREKLQLGYTAPNAAFAAMRYQQQREPHPNDPLLNEDLIPYGQGFADGMADALENFTRDQPALTLAFGAPEFATKLYQRHSDDPEFDRSPAYEDGRRNGRREHAPSIYPALREREFIQRMPDRTPRA